MKVEIEDNLNKFGVKHAELKTTGENFEDKVAYCVKLLNKLDAAYEESDVEIKQRVIGSIFPEKLVYENNKCRTPRLNEAVKLICANNGRFERP